ncbi:hypothetical protein [Mesorhizobium sp. M1396]|uniref:hypothetical protein n=1 Tax=Mesorhizobium sp. M1396 TaxID=2957095 RepID=UPI00333E0A12
MRRLTDPPWQGRVVEIRLHTRRFRCANSQCPRRIFTERLPETVQPKARRTFGSAKARWRSGLRWVASRARAFRTGSYAGERRHAVADDPRGRVRAAGSAAGGGIDDWAWRKGQR